MKTHPEGRLLSNFRGRAVRTAPLEGPLAAPVAKPSRQGEVALRTDLISASVQLWFKQLRRLQSYKHAALANKVTLDAEVYRLNLWTAIKRGRGFEGLFAEWWPTRRHKTTSCTGFFAAAASRRPTGRVDFHGLQDQLHGL